jgi:16S rRNA processing protein RimM
VRIGAVLSANPAKRQVRLQIVGSYVPTLDGVTWLYTKLQSGQVLKSKVEKVQAVGANPIVTLVPGVTRDTVARLAKAALVVHADDIIRSATRYDLTELEGLNVETADGKVLGRVDTTFTTPAHGVMEMRRKNGASLLVPVIPEVIRSVDWDRSRIRVGDIAPYAADMDDDDDAPMTGVDT